VRALVSARRHTAAFNRATRLRAGGFAALR
jgi:hypothetical protein